ncbi:MAG: DUF1249 domain-containing protein [Pseudomonadota bacterium]
MGKSTYKVDLQALHALCEANYARLLRLFPDYEARNGTRFAVGGFNVSIDVLERSRYTTLFGIQSFGSASSAEAVATPFLSGMRIEVRAYHDAGMMEVVRFQSGGKTEGRYEYPNPSMHQQDEKQQQNSFLADWLSHCLSHGEVDFDLLKPGTTHA